MSLSAESDKGVALDLRAFEKARAKLLSFLGKSFSLSVVSSTAAIILSNKLRARQSRAIMRLGCGGSPPRAKLLSVLEKFILYKKALCNIIFSDIMDMIDFFEVVSMNEILNEILNDNIADNEKSIVEKKLTPEMELEQLKERLHEAELELSDKKTSLIEITAARNALYKSVQSLQMQLADVTAQRENDIQAYEAELRLRLEEKHELQEKYDLLVIKAKRYDDLQESLMNIKMKAEARALGVIDEAQEKAMDAVNVIDTIEKEVNLFREDIAWLRRDIKIGTITLDDRLDTLYKRICKSMDTLTKIKNDFYTSNNIPLGNEFDESFENPIPNIKYPDEEDIQEEQTDADKKV